MKKNKCQKEWEITLNLMTEEELQFIREHPVGYYPDFLDMAWSKREKVIENPYSVPETKAMIDAIIHIVGELGCQSIDYEDGEICFFCQGAEFSIRFDEQYDYIDIVDRSWKVVRLNDTDLVENMKHAINKANIWHSVTIAYVIDEEEQVMEIHSSSNIPYYPNMAYLIKSLRNKLCEMLSTHDYVDCFLQEEKENSLKQSYSLINTSVTN